MRYAAGLLALLMAGCATRSFDPPIRYVLTPEWSVNQAQTADETLAIRPLTAARPYRQQIVYREGLELGQYARVEWAELPGDAVTRALSDAIRDTGRFSDVGVALNLRQPRYVLTGSLRTFDLCKETEPWTAECEIRVEVRESLGPKTLYAQTLSKSVPLESNDVSALPVAMSKAVGEIVSEAANGIAESQ